MHARQVSTALLTLGATVGVVAGVGMALGFQPSTLPAALLDVAAYKLTFLAAAGLLAAGAVVARFASRAAHRQVASAPPAAVDAHVPAELRPGGPATVTMHERRHGEIERPSNT